MEGDAPISKAPSSDDPAPPAPSTKDDEIDKGGWWSSWTPLAKTLTGKNCTENQTLKIQMWVPIWRKRFRKGSKWRIKFWTKKLKSRSTSIKWSTQRKTSPIKLSSIRWYDLRKLWIVNSFRIFTKNRQNCPKQSHKTWRIWLARLLKILLRLIRFFRKPREAQSSR